MFHWAGRAELLGVHGSYWRSPSCCPTIKNKPFWVGGLPALGFYIIMHEAETTATLQPTPLDSFLAMRDRPTDPNPESFWPSKVRALVH